MYSFGKTYLPQLQKKSEQRVIINSICMSISQLRWGRVMDFIKAYPEYNLDNLKYLGEDNKHRSLEDYAVIQRNVSALILLKDLAFHMARPVNVPTREMLEQLIEEKSWEMLKAIKAVYSDYWMARIPKVKFMNEFIDCYINPRGLHCPVPLRYNPVMMTPLEDSVYQTTDEVSQEEAQTRPAWTIADFLEELVVERYAKTNSLRFQ